MILRAKIFLLWLLALAIPVQGFAAVLQACAPVMTHGVAAQPAGHAMHSMHAAQTTQKHDHHAGHDMQAMQMADAAHDMSHATQHTPHKNVSCSYCAACTTGAVFPLALNAPPVPDLPSREFIALPTSGFVGFLPENPDRPPAFL